MPKAAVNRKAKAVASLPTRTPKRTGKKGIGPVESTEQPDVEVAVEKKPRQARLPQMQDAKIEELEAAAEDYADIRDRRMALTTEEVASKEELLALMKKHEKKSYVHNGYDIKVVVESEKLKVRIKKEE